MYEKMHGRRWKKSIADGEGKESSEFSPAFNIYYYQKPERISYKMSVFQLYNGNYCAMPWFSYFILKRIK